MSIKINARETNVKIGKNPGFYYVMTPELYIALTKEKVIKEELQAAAIQITCYDRDGNIVKRVTSDDGGIVEDDNDNSGGGSLTPDPSPNGEGGDNGGGNDPEPGED